MTDRLTIKRRFAVILEDAITVAAPAGVSDDDIDEWAHDNWDRLYQEARTDKVAANMVLGNTPTDGPQIVWEDEHHDDIESIDDVYVVER